jgi:hypothetical protein
MAAAAFRLYGEPLSQVLFEKEIERVGVAVNGRAVVRIAQNEFASRGLSALSAAVAQGAVVALRHGSVDVTVANVRQRSAGVNGLADVCARRALLCVDARRRVERAASAHQ